MNSELFLPKICQYKRQEIKALYELGGVDQFNVTEKSFMPLSFYESCKQPKLSLIAEIKKASPSKGLINPNFDPIELAQQYSRLGACCLSVLTEKHYFLGHPDYLKEVAENASIPVIRKDFILDEIQLYEAKALGASAVLLIKAILTNNEAQHLLNVAKTLNLDVLMEVHTKEELDEIASLDGIKICGVNNRNLKTFKTDISLALSLYADMRRMFGKNAVLVAESGYNNADQLKAIEDCGFDAVLIGEGLVTHVSMAGYFKH